MKNIIVMKQPTTWHGEMWREGAPCGNGTVGALVYGGISKELILLNHTQLWRGGHTLDEIPDVSASLAKVRELLDNNRPDLANSVLSNALREENYGPYECAPLPMCDVQIDHRITVTHHHYRRIIDMDKAEVIISWDENNKNISRRSFVSRADGLFYIQISSENALDEFITLDKHDTETIRDFKIINPSRTVCGNTVIYSADNETVYKPAQGRYGAVMRVFADGDVKTEENGIHVTGANKITVVVALAVGCANTDEVAEYAKMIPDCPDYEKALTYHCALYTPMFNANTIELANKAEIKSNEELLLDAFDDEMSNELTERMYKYGRYLFLCSTGSAYEKSGKYLPTHLLGLWNGTYQCFWAFHMFNINFEMIYWQALTGGLHGELRTALDYVEGFMDDFRENAKKIFGCRGIYIDSVNTPESGKAACLADHIINWTAGAAWVAEHFYDYYRYTGDMDYLKNHALPFMMETALFYEDFLVPGKDGRLEFSPSTSPENVSSTTKNKFNSGAQASKNSSMDIGCATELLTNCIEAAKLTGMYTEKISTWENMLANLPEYKFNADGSLKEWADDFYEDYTSHRHQSHMYGLFPAHSINENSPEYEGFVKAEDRRINEGLAAQSSWSMVFMACVRARMKQGEKAFEALSTMVRSCCMKNLFTTHNDWRRMGSVECDDFRTAPFQIDANIGFSGAVNEMLLCSADGTLTLLPALPAKWEEGRITGLSAACGYSVSIDWTATTAYAYITGGYKETVVKTANGWKFEDGTTEKPLTGECRLTLIRA